MYTSVLYQQHNLHYVQLEYVALPYLTFFSVKMLI